MAIDYKKILLLIGIALIPFYELAIRLLPDAVILTPDTRAGKLSLSLLIAMAIGLTALYQGVTLKVSNKWLLAFLVFILISINRSISIPLVVNGIDSSSFWVWKPFVYILIYFLMFIGVSSLELTQKTQKQIILMVYYAVLAMVFYIFLQYLGIDQFYKVKDVALIGTVTTPNLIGTLGQPTLVSPFLGIGIIMAISLKKYIPAVFMALFLVILDSKMAIGSTLVSCVVYLGIKKPKLIPYLVAISLISSVFVIKDFKINDMSGRQEVYKQLIQDWKTSPIEGSEYRTPVFTGVGLGSYGYLFTERHATQFKQTHSDPLEILYSLGLIGLFLYVMASIECIKRVILCNGEYVATFISAFILLHLVSCGTFIFQLGVYQYLGIMFFGILSNQSLIGRE